MLVNSTAKINEKYFNDQKKIKKERKRDRKRDRKRESD